MNHFSHLKFEKNSALEDAVGPGDIIVSMLPADQHLALARMAIGKGAHFVSSSYIAPDMAALDQAAKAAFIADGGADTSKSPSR